MWHSQIVGQSAWDSGTKSGTACLFKIGTVDRYKFHDCHNNYSSSHTYVHLKGKFYYQQPDNQIVVLLIVEPPILTESEQIKQKAPSQCT